jgi:phosphomannomutase
MIVKSVSGIRGIVGDGLDPERVLEFSAHFGQFIKAKSVMVGRDSRNSGESLKDAATAGLMGVGVNVIDLGMVPTPTLLYNVKISNASGGIVITASHNASEWNALKFVSKNGEFLNKEDMEEFLSILGKKIKWKRNDKFGNKEEKKNAIDEHINGVLKNNYINVPLINKRKFKVVIDCVNGGASLAYPHFLSELNVKYYPIFCEGNGKFLRKPEPRKGNLSVLEKKVKDTKSDVGFATDPDGDRLVVVTDKGETLSEELTIVLATLAVFSKKKGPVVVNLSTTRSMNDITKRAGVPLYRSPVGEANVVKLMKKKKAIIGGEGNGGVIFPEIQYTRDAMVAMTLILQYITDMDKPLSHIMNTIPQYKIIKKEIKMKSREEQLNFIEKIKKENKDKKLNLRDGIRIEESNRWVHIRISGTEPIIRIIAEAPTKEGAMSLYKMVKEQGVN